MKVIRNTKSGHTYTLLRTSADTSGASLEMEVAYLANSAEPPAHYHPFQSERFRVLSGELMVRMNNQVRTLRTGDTLDVPPNTVHSMWNDTGNAAMLEWIVSPALETEQFFDTFAELANNGRTHRQSFNQSFRTNVTFMSTRYAVICPSSMSIFML